MKRIGAILLEDELEEKTTKPTTQKEA